MGKIRCAGWIDDNNGMDFSNPNFYKNTLELSEIKITKWRQFCNAFIQHEDTSVQYTEVYDVKYSLYTVNKHLRKEKHLLTLKCLINI